MYPNNLKEDGSWGGGDKIFLKLMSTKCQEVGPKVITVFLFISDNLLGEINI